VMAVPWWAWGIVQLPMFSVLVGSWIYFVGKALPVALLIWALWPGLRSVLRRPKPHDRSLSHVQ